MASPHPLSRLSRQAALALMLAPVAALAQAPRFPTKPITIILPIAPGEQWKPVGNAQPTGHILWLLFACIGLPYLVLAATGPGAFAINKK